VESSGASYDPYRDGLPSPARLTTLVIMNGAVGDAGAPLSMMEVSVATSSASMARSAAAKHEA
jgi:hypothetical protein